MSRIPPRRARMKDGTRRTSAAVAAALMAAALTGCAPGAGATDSTGSGAGDGGFAAASPQPTRSASPATPGAGGTAAENLPLFTEITEAVWSSDGRAAGRAYVDALTAAGFDKAAMQVTEDMSTVGNAAESIQFSVRWGDECLVGQVGPATGDPVAAVVPVLAEGTCLVGDTRPIDW